MPNLAELNFAFFFNDREGPSLVTICSVISLSICFLWLSRLLLYFTPRFLFNKFAIKVNYIKLFPFILFFIIWLFFHEQRLSLILLLSLYFLFSYLLAIIDYHTMYLPDVLVFPLLVFGIIYNLVIPLGNIMLSIYGIFGGYLFLWFLAGTMQWFNKRRQLGDGDIKLIAAYGAWLGVLKLPQLLVGAAFCGIIHYLYYYWRNRQRTAAIPFGPSIVLSALYWQLIDPYYPWFSD